VAAVIGGFLGHVLGARGKDKAVEQAKSDTSNQTRAEVAIETQAAATRAKTEATSSRQASDAEAHAIADKGPNALDDALKAQGRLRD
jgi:hypothetical protein